MSSLKIPVIELHQWITYKLESSISTKEALSLYIVSRAKEPAAKEIVTALNEVLQNPEAQPKYFLTNPYRRQVLELLCRGLQGQSILQPWRQLGEELYFQLDYRIDEQLTKLPTKLLVPLMLFVLPAYLLMLLAPLTLDLIQSF